MLAPGTAAKPSVVYTIPKLFARIELMPITYGLNLSRSVYLQSLLRTSLMKSYTSHSEKSDVFLSYQHSDQAKALELAKYLDRQGREVFIDIYDDTLQPGDYHIDNALMTAINNSDTMVIVVSDETQASWWVPWEIGVSTPYQKPRAMYRPMVTKQLPAYLKKLERLRDLESANRWVASNKGKR